MAQFITIGDAVYNVAHIHSVTASRNPNPPSTGDVTLLTVAFSDAHAVVLITGPAVNQFRQDWANLGLPRIPVV